MNDLRRLSAFFSKRYYVLSVISFVLMLGATLLWMKLIFILQTEGAEDLGSYFSFAMPLMVLPDMFNDFFEFGACMSKGAVQMELCKSSMRGDALCKKVYIIDALRRCLVFILVWFIASLCYVNSPWVMGYLFYLLSVAYLGVIISVNRVRKYGGVNIMMLFFYMSIAVTSFLMGCGTSAWMRVGNNWRDNVQRMFLPGLVVLIPAVMLTVRTLNRTMQHWKEQYYDKA